MRVKIIYWVLLSMMAGLLLGISFPFTGGLLPLAFMGFVPLLVVNFQLNEQKRFRFLLRFGLNYLAFVIFNALTTWWIYYASKEGVYMAVFANSLLMTIPFFFGGFIARQLGEGRGLIAFVVLWLSFEYAHFYWELSWPWLNLGHMLGNSPKLMQWYEYSGVTGGSLWILVINVLVYLVVRNLWIRKEPVKIQTPIFLFIVLGVVIPVASSLLIYYNYEEKHDPVNIIIVQPNIEAHTEKFATPGALQLDKMFRLAMDSISEETDLVLCPETAIINSLDESRIEEQGPVLYVKQFLDTNYRVPMLIGACSEAYFPEENSVASKPFANFWYEDYNTACMIQCNMPTQLYHKSKLVLGSEKLPFVSWFPFLKEYAVELGGTSGVLGIGKEAVNLQASGLKFAPVICYESVYGEYVTQYTAKGADVLTVITNDGWWQDTPGYKQHRMFSQIRAIENRRSVARSANTGISCFIDQQGEIIAELGWNEAGIIQAEINRNDKFTFFVRYGDIIGRISLFLALSLYIFAIVAWVRKKGIRTA
jgi:apolipoprotein N-acyltransferase